MSRRCECEWWFWQHRKKQEKNEQLNFIPHKLRRWYDEVSVVSLRDVKCVNKCFVWFYEQLSRKYGNCRKFNEEKLNLQLQQLTLLLVLVIILIIGNQKQNKIKFELKVATHSKRRELNSNLCLSALAQNRECNCDFEKVVNHEQKDTLMKIVHYTNDR